MLAYGPTFNAGFIWDDDDYVTENETLSSSTGILDIWLTPRATPQYYPLVFTSFWVEYRLWGLHATGYHLTNILLHALSAVLLWRILLQLQVPGAFLAAAIFALHPVHVESVTWVTERKNVLSLAWYLGAAYHLIRFFRLEADRDAEKSPLSKAHYWLALVFFVFALLSKTVVSTLPAAMLLLIWWKRGRIDRYDFLVLLPFFVLGIGSGLFTVWLEKYHVGAEDVVWELSYPERILIAGRAIWFYAWKLVWPVPLMFNYPRWAVDASIWWQYLFPAGVIAVALALWMLRNWLGRGPLTAVLFFCGSLFPALGFFDVYPFRYSFVADHFQYHASIGMIVLFSAGVGSAFRQNRLLPAFVIGCVVLLAALVFQTWRHAGVYHDLETLWNDTLEKNPRSYLASNNLGSLLQKENRPLEAMAYFRTAVALEPAYAEAHNNLGTALAAFGKTDEALSSYKEAIRLDPANPKPYNNIGIELSKQGNAATAVDYFEKALQYDPGYVDARTNLGLALADQGEHARAKRHFEKVLSVSPDKKEAHYGLGMIYLHTGKSSLAADHFEKALQIDPDYAQAHHNVGSLFAMDGQYGKALRHLEKAVSLNPDLVIAHENAGAIYYAIGKTAKAVEHYRKALRIQPDQFELQYNLGVILANQGAVDQALPHFLEAVRLLLNSAEAHAGLVQVHWVLGDRKAALHALAEVERLDAIMAEQLRKNLGINS